MRTTPAAAPGRGARSRPTRPAPRSLAAALSVAGASLALVPPRALVRYALAAVAAWFSSAFLSPLHPDAGARARLLASGASFPSPLPVSLVAREREGGRRYAFWLADYRGPRVASLRASRGARRRASAAVLLPAIPRSVRSAFPAPPGCRYLLADIERCFPVLLATVSRDHSLLAAARGDLHQTAGDAMAPGLPAAERRRLGKLFNNAVIGLITPTGWQAELLRHGLSITRAEAQAMHARWWERFPDARRFRDAWIALHRNAAARHLPIRLSFPDGRQYSFDTATVRGAARRPKWDAIGDPKLRLAASIRTTFSAIWRGVEGVLLDEALARVYALRDRGVRLVLPMYDGLLLQVPDDQADALVPVVRAAMHEAFTHVGVPATASVVVSPTWSGKSAGGCLM